METRDRDSREVWALREEGLRVRNTLYRAQLGVEGLVNVRYARDQYDEVRRAVPGTAEISEEKAKGRYQGYAYQAVWNAPSYIEEAEEAEKEAARLIKEWTDLRRQGGVHSIPDAAAEYEILILQATQRQAVYLQTYVRALVRDPVLFGGELFKPEEDEDEEIYEEDVTIEEA